MMWIRWSGGLPLYAEWEASVPQGPQGCGQWQPTSRLPRCSLACTPAQLDGEASCWQAGLQEQRGHCSADFE